MFSSSVHLVAVASTVQFIWLIFLISVFILTYSDVIQLEVDLLIYMMIINFVLSLIFIMSQTKVNVQVLKFLQNFLVCLIQFLIMKPYQNQYSMKCLTYGMHFYIIPFFDIH